MYINKNLQLQVYRIFSRDEHSERCKKQDFINLCTVKKFWTFFVSVIEWNFFDKQLGGKTFHYAFA